MQNWNVKSHWYGMFTYVQSILWIYCALLSYSFAVENRPLAPQTLKTVRNDWTSDNFEPIVQCCRANFVHEFQSESQLFSKNYRLAKLCTVESVPSFPLSFISLFCLCCCNLHFLFQYIICRGFPLLVHSKRKLRLDFQNSIHTFLVNIQQARW